MRECAVRRGADAYVRGGWGWVLRCRGERRSERAWCLRELGGGVTARRRVCVVRMTVARARGCAGMRTCVAGGAAGRPWRVPRWFFGLAESRECAWRLRGPGGGVVCVMRVLASLGEGSEVCRSDRSLGALGCHLRPAPAAFCAIIPCLSSRVCRLRRGFPRCNDPFASLRCAGSCSRLRLVSLYHSSFYLCCCAPCGASAYPLTVYFFHSSSCFSHHLILARTNPLLPAPRLRVDLRKKPRLWDAFLTPPVPAASSNTYSTVPSTTICRERKVCIIPSFFILHARPIHIPTSSPPSFPSPSLSPPSPYVATHARTALSRVKSTRLRVPGCRL
ncbi:hypothetical protein B0H16DRAFT_1542103 [Mycena metata]|uniref:Uncharacterized protein n=1 Tax=Mycena metata TaxID=1033252 RepID=A0AAD7J2I8_9AGAR|nr:hypothetical protein B0H16DRAFT_1542103 [Mycena metata]